MRSKQTHTLSDKTVCSPEEAGVVYILCLHTQGPKVFFFLCVYISLVWHTHTCAHRHVGSRSELAAQHASLQLALKLHRLRARLQRRA